MQEETGICIRIVKFLDEFLSDNGTLVKWYLCEPITFEMKPDDDLEEVKFVPKEDVTSICAEEAVLRWPKKVVEFFSA